MNTDRTKTCQKECDVVGASTLCRYKSKRGKENQHDERRGLSCRRQLNLESNAQRCNSSSSMSMGLRKLSSLRAWWQGCSSLAESNLVQSGDEDVLWKRRMRLSSIRGGVRGNEQNARGKGQGWGAFLDGGCISQIMRELMQVLTRDTWAHELHGDVKETLGEEEQKVYSGFGEEFENRVL